MNFSNQKPVRFLSALLFVAIFFVSSFAAAPQAPAARSWNTGNVCNYSSKELAVIVQRGQDLKEPGWKVLQSGGCQKDNVVAILGRKCTGSTCSNQMVALNNGRAIVLDSLRSSSSSQGLLVVVPMDRNTQVLPLKQSVWYALNTYKSSFLRTLPYALEVEKVKFKRPVGSLGDGMTKSLGSPAHANLDAYALDYSAYVNWDKRNPTVYPALPGQVVYSDCTTDYGCAVVVRTQDQTHYGVIYYAVYARLANAGRPAVGTAVDTSKSLGAIDMTPGIKGSYLHFSVRVGTALYDGTNALYGSGKMYPFNVRWFLNR